VCQKYSESGVGSKMLIYLARDTADERSTAWREGMPKARQLEQ
jgi:hypothetical protein